MSEQIAKLNIEEKLIACIELAQKRQADIQALRAENARLKEALAQIAKWDKRAQSETAQSVAQAALQPERGTP